MKIGVFGGSFDPVHRGHLVAAEHVLKALGLDQIRFVLARQQPLKAEGHVAPVEHRLAMLDVALRSQPHFVVDRSELDRPGPSYTVDTLRGLRAAFPRDQLFLIVGADAARDLGRWRDADRLPELARVIVVNRPGARMPQDRLISQVLEIPAVDVSATEIRDAVRRGDAFAQWVPPGVDRYITEHRLYRSGD